MKKVLFAIMGIGFVCSNVYAAEYAGPLGACSRSMYVNGNEARFSYEAVKLKSGKVVANFILQPDIREPLEIRTPLTRTTMSCGSSAQMKLTHCNITGKDAGMNHNGYLSFRFEIASAISKVPLTEDGYCDLVYADTLNNDNSNVTSSENQSSQQQTSPEKISAPIAVPVSKANDTVEIMNVYKVSDSKYTVTYEYKGERKTIIKTSPPKDGVMSMSDFMRL